MVTFTAETSKVARVRLGPGEHVVARRGAMLAYTGDVRFSPAHSGAGSGGAGSGGLGGLVGAAGRAVAGEGTRLMVAEGDGEVLYGHAGLSVTVLQLDGAAPLSVEADRLLAHDGALDTSVVFLGSFGGVRGVVRGAVSGQGLFTTQVSGSGGVALLSHGGTIALPVRGSIGVDPQAYVAHTGDLDVRVTTAGAGGMLRDAVGRGSGESVQLRVTGTGTVHVQASEQKL